VRCLKISLKVSCCTVTCTQHRGNSKVNIFCDAWNVQKILAQLFNRRLTRLPRSLRNVILSERRSYCPYCTTARIVASHAPLSSYPTKTSGGTRARERDPWDPGLAHGPSMAAPSSTLAPTSLRRTSHPTRRNTTDTALSPPYTIRFTSPHFLAFILLAIPDLS
jgi:hypothetical protein